MRSLQQFVDGNTTQVKNPNTTQMAEANVTRVPTPVELLEALQRGDRDVVITEHMDLTSLQPLGAGSALCPTGCSGPLQAASLLAINGTRSLRVRASSPFFPMFCAR